ncbi:hypothetical protein ACF061_37565 [Streptomyces sp. NPDC015220]|uniref:hypothetical protein n=1 Tax=Streptomyces sp. NPDC015220 TaxID=3364947 RepID=UPI0036FACC7B
MDDDQWMYVIVSKDLLGEYLEPAFLDDITDAFDGLARPLDFAAHPMGADAEVRVRGVEPALARLQMCAAAFFQVWTHDDPPQCSADPQHYVRSLVEAYERERERRRKRR